MKHESVYDHLYVYLYICLYMLQCIVLVQSDALDGSKSNESPIVNEVKGDKRSATTEFEGDTSLNFVFLYPRWFYIS